MLLKDVWGYKFVPATNLVDVQICHLRQKVDGSGETPLIKTVRGAGFVLRSGGLGQASERKLAIQAPVAAPSSPM